MSKPDEWLDLQVEVFLRWVNKRLALRSTKVADLKGFGSGEPLVALMEILSEKPCPFKLKPGALTRMQQMDNCSYALKFITTTCGIKNTCSAENLVDGEPKAVLGLLWAIMSTYLKFQDDDDGPALSVKDSLMMWFQNQMTDAALASSITDVTKSFHSGLVIAATVAKFRPQLIDVGSMDAKEGPANLKKAFDAATAFFGLEQYLTPAEMVKLDEKGMIVFLSEFFYGIAAQCKVQMSSPKSGVSGAAVKGEAAQQTRQVFTKFLPDVVGCQEPLQHQLDELQALLTPAIYRHLSVGRTADLSDENMAIFYNHHVVRPLESGSLWLSDTPSVPGSTSWGNYWLRCMLWIKFYHIKSRETFYHFNTHLDTAGEAIRLRESQFITQKISEIAGTNIAILTADFNSPGGLTPTWKHYQTAGYTDCYMEAEQKRGKLSTWTGFRGAPEDDISRFDWILCKGARPCRILDYENFDQPIGGRYPSDHSPVVAKVTFAPEREIEKKTADR